MPTQPVTRRMFLIGYVILALGLLYAVNLASDEGRRRDEAVCASQAEGRKNLLDVLQENRDFIANTVQTPSDVTRQYLEVLDRQLERYRQPPTCAEDLNIAPERS